MVVPKSAKVRARILAALDSPEGLSTRDFRDLKEPFETFLRYAQAPKEIIDRVHAGVRAALQSR